MTGKIFITGATGTIGSQIVKRLQTENIPFTAGLSKAPENAPDYDYAIIDYGDIASMEQAFADVDNLFLLFPVADDLMSWTTNVIEAAKKAGVKHIVRSGANGATLNSPYQLIQLHAQIDEKIKASGINYTITQPTGFMQNFVTFLGYSIKQGTVYNSNPDGKVAFIDARDIAAVNVAILKTPTTYAGQTINISGGESLTIPDGIGRISKVIGRPVNYIPISHEAAHEALKKYGASDYVANLIGSIEKASQDGAMATTLKNVEKVTGKAPISFDQFVEDYKDVWI